MQGGDTVQILSAGLPQIEGGIGTLIWFDDTPSKAEQTGWGCFKSSNNVTQNKTDAGVSTGSGWYNTNLHLSAADSNAIYGQSSTVRPPTLKLIPQIRY